MGLLFKFGQAVLETFKFLQLKKLALFGILGGDYKGLGHVTKIWGKWAQNGFWGITWQPPVRFFHATPHFIQNFMKKTGLFFTENLDPKGAGS